MRGFQVVWKLRQLVVVALDGAIHIKYLQNTGRKWTIN